jgi:hypothetical protein
MPLPVIQRSSAEKSEMVQMIQNFIQAIFKFSSNTVPQRTKTQAIYYTNGPLKYGNVVWLWDLNFFWTSGVGFFLSTQNKMRSKKFGIQAFFIYLNPIRVSTPKKYRIQVAASKITNRITHTKLCYLSAQSRTTKHHPRPKFF